MHLVINIEIMIIMKKIINRRNNFRDHLNNIHYLFIRLLHKYNFNINYNRDEENFI